MIWLDTKTEEDASRRRSAMWGMTWSEAKDGSRIGTVNGEGLYEDDRFWAEAIKGVRDDPAARFAMAARHLPLPAAFREAAIALRAIIRAKRKSGDAFKLELLKLHELAAVSSLAMFGWLEATPYAYIRNLDLSPATVGWEALPLLGKNDWKLMAEA